MCPGRHKKKRQAIKACRSHLAGLHRPRVKGNTNEQCNAHRSHADSRRYRLHSLMRNGRRCRPRGLDRTAARPVTPPVKDCPACAGSGDEWHQPYYSEPPEPYPCPACAGSGLQRNVEPVVPKPGFVDAILDTVIYDLCGSPATLLDLEFSKQIGVFTETGATLSMDPREVEAACCRIIGADEPELPF